MTMIKISDVALDPAEILLQESIREMVKEAAPPVSQNMPVPPPPPAPYRAAPTPATAPAAAGVNSMLTHHNHKQQVQTQVQGNIQSGRATPESMATGMNMMLPKTQPKTWSNWAASLPGAVVGGVHEGLNYDPEYKMRRSMTEEAAGAPSNEAANNFGAIVANQPTEMALDTGISKVVPGLGARQIESTMAQAGRGLGNRVVGTQAGRNIGRSVGRSVGGIVGKAGLPGLAGEVAGMFGYGPQFLAGPGIGAETGLPTERDLQPNDPQSGASKPVRDELNERLSKYNFKNITQLEQKLGELDNQIPALQGQIKQLRAQGLTTQADGLERGLQRQREMAANYRTLLLDRESLHVQGGDTFGGATYGSTIKEHQADSMNPFTGRSGIFNVANNMAQGAGLGDWSQAHVDPKTIATEFSSTVGIDPKDFESLPPAEQAVVKQQALHVAQMRKAYGQAGIDPANMNEDLAYFGVLGGDQATAQKLREMARDPNQPLEVREKLLGVMQRHNQVQKAYRDMQGRSSFDNGITSGILGAGTAKMVADRFNPVTAVNHASDMLHQTAIKPWTKQLTGTMSLREKIDPTTNAPKGTMEHWIKSKQRDAQDFLNPEMVAAREGMNATDVKSQAVASDLMGRLDQEAAGLGAQNWGEVEDVEAQLRDQRTQLMMKNPTSPEFKRVDERWRGLKGMLDRRRLAADQEQGKTDNYGANNAAHTAPSWFQSLTGDTSANGRMMAATPENPYENPLTFGKADADVQKMLEQARIAQQKALVSGNREAAGKYDAMVQELQYGLKRRAGFQGMQQAKDTSQTRWYNPGSWGNYLAAGALQ